MTTLIWEFLPHWKAKLVDLIAETPFSALLVHVLTESRNRDAITDAFIEFGPNKTLGHGCGISM